MWRPSKELAVGEWGEVHSCVVGDSVEDKKHHYLEYWGPDRNEGKKMWDQGGRRTDARRCIMDQALLVVSSVCSILSVERLCELLHLREERRI